MISREISRGLGYASIIGALWLGSPIFDALKVNTQKADFRLIASEKGVIYHRSGIKSLRRISCMTVPVDSYKPNGLHFTGPGRAIVALPLSALISDQPNLNESHVLDTKECKYPAV